MAPAIGIEPTTIVSYQVILCHKVSYLLGYDGHKGLYDFILSVALLWHYRRKFGIILGSGFKKS